MDNRPVVYRNNEMTQKADALAAVNAERGLPAGRDTLSVIGLDMPSVRSAALGLPVPVLPPDEVKRLNINLIRMGMDPVTRRELSPEEIEEALAAEGVGPEPEEREPERLLPSQYGQQRQTAREFLSAAPRQLLNFSNLQSVDLVNGTLLVDGTLFEISESDLAKWKKWAIGVAYRAVNDQLAAASAGLGIGRRGRRKAVRTVPVAVAPVRVQPKQRKARRKAAVVPTVPARVKEGVASPESPAGDST